MNYPLFVRIQSMILMSSSIIFPFYLLLVRQIGDSYAQFGLAYGLFTLTSAFAYLGIGRLSDRFGDRSLLVTHTFGMALILLYVPIVTSISHVYLIQIIMGILGALQKNTEKTILARQELALTTVGRAIGRYHFKTSLWSALGIIAAGYLIDFLTIGSLFYIISAVYLYVTVRLLWDRPRSGKKHTEDSSSGVEAGIKK
ncbi:MULTISPECIES: MFS transporter [unclassified Exiguobacterium]|uniref:MFS transporter n=1 Tax=unclassified Exiguobacterium TaxID=2644629 RepID=UPI000DF864E6|nr:MULTISPECIES: MFS transporter [unclassified Exiguobacterium]RDB34653.1 MFS transporter [Exiguobacterium sp. RIT594]HCN59005.1 MFS transporter [Exiguobacterium sp.]